MNKNTPITSFARYLNVFFMVVIAYFIFAITLNWCVDPFNELNRNSLGIYFGVERQMKGGIVDYPHDAVVIGTSKVGSINPKSLNCYEFYNSSFDGALPEEIYFYLKQYLTKERLVVVGLDFEMFNERQWPLAKMNAWTGHSFGKLEYLINFNVVRSSVITLYKAYKKVPPVISSDGHRTGEGRYKAYQEQPNMTLADIPHVHHDFSNTIGMLKANHLRRFLMSKERFVYLRKIKALLEEKKIPYVIFINPYNQHVYELIRSLNEEELLNEWVKEVKTIFPDVHDFSYSQYSMNDDYFGASDAYHYVPEVGTILINSIIPCTKKR